MQHAVNVWGAVKKDDTKRLKRWFSLRAHRTFTDVCYTPDERWPASASRPIVQFISDPGATAVRLFPIGADRRGDPSDIAVPSDPRGWAVEWLRVVVNARLRSHTRAALLYVPGSDPQSPGLNVVPNTLLGALWLQFARAVEGQDRFRQCPMCQRWFRMAPKAKATTTFCSTACRVRDLRTRKATAVRLAKKGVPVAEIAVLVNSSPDTVRTWVGGH